jgi:glutaredoxin
MVTKYVKPANKNYTIYTISNCKYCDMAKEQIKKTSKYDNIKCDKFIETCRERDKFYKFMKELTIIPYYYFPMIFKNGKFIGGLKELLTHKKVTKVYK